jgi:hypothetical protein
MGNAWSKHVGEWYAANSGKNGINSLKDAMRSSQCKADFRAKMGGPAMKTEKNVMKKGKKGTRKVKGGSSLSPANFASEPIPMSKSDTPIKGGKKGSSLEKVLKEVGKMISKGSFKKSKKLRGGAINLNSVTSAQFNDVNNHITEAKKIDLSTVDISNTNEKEFSYAVEIYTALDPSANFSTENKKFKNAFENYENALSATGGSVVPGAGGAGAPVSGGKVDVMVHVTSGDGKKFEAEIVSTTKP